MAGPRHRKKTAVEVSNDQPASVLEISDALAWLSYVPKAQTSTFTIYLDKRNRRGKTTVQRDNLWFKRFLEHEKSCGCNGRGEK